MHSILKSTITSFFSIIIIILASDSMTISSNPWSIHASKAFLMARASAAAALWQNPKPEPPAAWSSPAKSRPSQPTPMRIVLLHQAASVLILIVLNLGFCHLAQVISVSFIVFGSRGL
ncbi:hypothetical protein ACFX2A_044980 [Malus domestica]